MHKMFIKPCIETNKAVDTNIIFVYDVKVPYPKRGI